MGIPNREPSLGFPSGSSHMQPPISGLQFSDKGLGIFCGVAFSGLVD